MVKKKSFGNFLIYYIGCWIIPYIKGSLILLTTGTPIVGDWEHFIWENVVFFIIACTIWIFMDRKSCLDFYLGSSFFRGVTMAGKGYHKSQKLIKSILMNVGHFHLCDKNFSFSHLLLLGFL